jgi:hypothetical protein
MVDRAEACRGARDAASRQNFRPVAPLQRLFETSNHFNPVDATWGQD